MRVFKNNEELKSLIIDGNIIIHDDISCDFNINDNANINANDINANDIKAFDINAGNINAKDIEARDVSYYAFCVAYKDIECESIKGRRDNSFHKCLDGKLTIKEKLKEITINGETFHLNKENIEDLKNQLNNK
jgi:polyisoprenoid-binding protein YceI